MHLFLVDLPQRYLKRNVNLHDLNEQARVFYGGINCIMERLNTIPEEWLDFCVDKDVYPSDVSAYSALMSGSD